MHSKSEFLGTTSVHKLMVNFGTFALISMIATGSVSMVGALIVSRGIDIHAVGAMGILFPLTSVFFGFSQLVAIGAASYISRMLGKDKHDVAISAIITAYCLSIIISTTLIALTLLFKTPLLAFLGADGAYTDTAKTYLSVYVFSIPFTAMTLLASAIFRAYGKLKLSMCIIVLDALLVLGIDYVLVFWMDKGMGGVALSNALGSLISSTLGIILLIKLIIGKKNIKRKLSFCGNIITGIGAVGVSALGRALSVSTFAFILNSTLNNLAPDEVITALGTVNRIVMLLLYTIMGMNQAMQPIISYNFTAGNFDRVKQGLKYAIFYASLIGVIGTLAGLIFPHQILRIFTSNDDILDDATFILRMQLVLYFTFSIQTLTATYFQAIGKGKMSFFLSVFKPLLILLPLVLILPRLSDDIFRLWWMYPIADTLTTLVAGFILFHSVRKLAVKPKTY